MEAKDTLGIKLKACGMYPLLDYQTAISDWKLEVGNMTFLMNEISDLKKENDRLTSTILMSEAPKKNWFQKLFS